MSLYYTSLNNAKVRAWDFQHNGDPLATSKYAFILDHLQYHASKDWRVYLPAEHPDFNPSYLDRLAAWIGNLPDESHQKLLLEYALHISFFSHDDFVALYSTALNREVTRWVAFQIGASLEPSGGRAFHSSIHQEIHERTWFCPVTDSMDINEFYKVNHLKGVGHRPGFATIQMLAEEAGEPNLALAANMRRYMTACRLERLVLLEDIVGSGSQCLKAVRWAVANIEKPVLFIPLILCPNGDEFLQTEVRRSIGRLTVSPIIELHRGDLLGPERQDHSGWPIAAALEELARHCIGHLGIAVHDAFGYSQTGCSLATFTNTPNNSLPIIHRKPNGGNWHPLFPRVSRD